MHAYEVLRRPIVTEKSTMLGALGKYVFEVALHANKQQIRAAVERAFEVHVTAVNTAIVRGKPRRLGKRQAISGSDWKKAVVTLRAGEQIEIFGGV
ncbi:MAG: 50S ribosomal protein L23 [Dehalococcoidia bacterium]|nr:50S ribosomal protein L23 [Dehalococcoidia bacterium]